MNVGALMNLLRCRKHGSLYKPVVRLSLSYQSFNFLTSKSAINSEWSNTNTAAIRIHQVFTTGHSLCFPCRTIFQSCKEKRCLTIDLANHPCLIFDWYYWSYGRNDSPSHITGNALSKKKQELRMMSRQLCLPVFFKRSCSSFLSFALHWSWATLTFLPFSTILVRSLTRDWQFLWLSWHCLRFPPSTTLPFSHVALLCWHLFRSSLRCCTALLSALISPFCLFCCKVEVWRN